MKKQKINNFQLKAIIRALKQPERLDDYEKGFCESMQKSGDQAMVSVNQNKMINKIGSKLR